MRNEEITISASRGALRVLRGLVDTDAGSEVSNCMLQKALDHVTLAACREALIVAHQLEMIELTECGDGECHSDWYRVKRMTTARKMLICAAIARCLGVPA
jgi:hypothetical protein